MYQTIVLNSHWHKMLSKDFQCVAKHLPQWRLLHAESPSPLMPFGARPTGGCDQLVWSSPDDGQNQLTFQRVFFSPPATCWIPFSNNFINLLYMCHGQNSMVNGNQSCPGHGNHPLMFRLDVTGKKYWLGCLAIVSASICIKLLLMNPFAKQWTNSIVHLNIHKWFQHLLFFGYLGYLGYLNGLF